MLLTKKVLEILMLQSETRFEYKPAPATPTIPVIHETPVVNIKQETTKFEYKALGRK